MLLEELALEASNATLIGPRSLSLEQPTLLSENAARMISSISTVTRFSIRFSALVMELFFETAKHSALASMGLSRRALITAITAARQQHFTSEERSLITNGDQDYASVMDKCTNLGIYVVHHTFTLAELFAMSGFHFFSNSMKNGLWAAEESVRVLDGLFGSTETSRALASVVMLVRKELFEDQNFSLREETDRKKLLASIAKAMTAFACLQAVTHKRHSSSLKYTIKYRGFVPLKVLESEDEVSQNNCQNSRAFLIQKKAACELEFSCTLKVRRSKSFSFLPNENTVPSGVVELLDQSSDLGKGVHSNIGEQTLFDRLPTRSRSSAASSPPSSPVPSWVGIEGTLEYSKDFIPKESTFIPLIYRFMRYSTAAYGSNFIRLLGMASWDDVEMPVHHPNVHSFSKHTSLPLDSIIYSSFSSVSSCFSSGPGGLLEPANLNPLVHYVTVDHGVRAIVLTCRGTLGISDALTDLTCEYDPVQVGDKTFLAHSGILSTARALADVSSEVHSVIRKALEDYPDYGLTLCGHSLGGGVVSLISMLWATRSMDEFGATSFALGPQSKLPVGRPVYCYTYGSPSVISYEGSVYLQGLVTSIVYGSDLVPSLSLGTLRDFKNVATTLADEENLIQQIITRSLGISGKLLNTDVPLQQVTSDVSGSSIVRSANASDDWFWSLIKTMRADMQSEKLYPPGEIYHITSCTTPVDLARVIRQSENGNCPKRSVTIPALTTGSSHSSVQCLEVTLKRCENTIDHFREINFSCTMFSDHSPRAYEDSLKALVASLSLGEL